MEQNAHPGTGAEAAAADAANQLKEAIHESDRISNLAINPLLLSIVALVHKNLGILPRDRTKLYAQSVSIFLELWDVKKGIRVDDTGLTLDQKDALMRSIAHAMHVGRIGEAGGSRHARRSEITQEIDRLLPSFGKEGADANQLLNDLAERSGLLVERSPNSFVFSHLTFQEYFTASKLSRDSSAIAVAFLTEPSRLLSDWWQEVILLYSSLVTDSSDLIRAIANLSDSDDLCAQRLRLACICTAESVSLGDAKLRDRIMLRLGCVRSRSLSWQVTSLPQPVADYLLRWCKGPEWYEAAAEAFLKQLLPDQSEHAVGMVVGALASDRWMVRKAAVHAAGVVDLKLSGLSLTTVVSFLADRQPSIRLAALSLLSKVETSTLVNELSFGPQLVSLLSDSSDEIKLAAVRLKLDISILAPVLSEYIGLLIRLSSSSDYALSSDASKALARIAKLAPSAVAVSIRSQPPELLIATGGKGLFKVAASLDSSLVLPQLPVLVKNLCSSNYSTASDARAKLSAMMSPTVTCEVAGLFRLRLSESLHVRESLIALQQCDATVCQELESELLKLARSWRSAVRANAAECVAQLVSDAAAQTLLTLAKDRFSRVRAAAVPDGNSPIALKQGATALKIWSLALRDRARRVVLAALKDCRLVDRDQASDAMNSLRVVFRRHWDNPSLFGKHWGGLPPHYYLSVSLWWLGRLPEYREEVTALMQQAAASRNFPAIARFRAIGYLCDFYCKEGRGEKFGEICTLLKDLSEQEPKYQYPASLTEFERLAILASAEISAQANLLLASASSSLRLSMVALFENAQPLETHVILKALADLDAVVRRRTIKALLACFKGQPWPDKVAERVFALHADADPATRNLAWEAFCRIQKPAVVVVIPVPPQQIAFAIEAPL